MTPMDDKARAEMQAQYRFLVINLCRITGAVLLPCRDRAGGVWYPQGGGVCVVSGWYARLSPCTCIPFQKMEK